MATETQEYELLAVYDDPIAFDAHDHEDAHQKAQEMMRQKMLDTPYREAFCTPFIVRVKGQDLEAQPYVDGDFSIAINWNGTVYCQPVARAAAWVDAFQANPTEPEKWPRYNE